MEKWNENRTVKRNPAQKKRGIGPRRGEVPVPEPPLKKKRAKKRKRGNGSMKWGMGKEWKTRQNLDFKISNISSSSHNPTPTILTTTKSGRRVVKRRLGGGLITYKP